MQNIQVTNSVLQTIRPDFVSDNYGFIKTQPIIDMIQARGWNLVDTKIQRAKVPHKIGFTKHKLIFEHPTLGNDGDSKPRLYLLNSHDRSSAFSFNLGFFRFICDNGLMIGDAIGQQFKVYHTGKDLEQSIYTKLVASLDAVPKAIELRDKMRALELTPSMETELVSRLDLVTANIRKLDKTTMQTTRNFLRPSDEAQDLWTVFNACQESSLNGGFYAARIHKRDGVETVSKTMRVRSIKGLDADVKLNKALFDEAVKYMTEVA